MNSRSWFRGIFWGLIAVLLLVHIGGGWMYSSRIIDEGFTPAPSPVVVPNGDYQLEEVTYDSSVGVMDAWYLPASSTTWVIHVHGRNATPAEPEPLFAPIQQAGYPQLSITYRNDEGQPADPSGYFRYGATEWEDVLAASEYAKANGARELVLIGYSTGASHVLSYAYLHDFDEIVGIVTDSANIDMGSTIDYRASLEKLPVIPVPVPPTMTWVAKFFTSLRIDVNWRSLDYVDKSTRSLRVPVLAFHGTADESIPPEESIALAEARPDLVDLVLVEGAGHVQSFEVDFEGYVTRLLAFLEGVG
jgi:pimeloyl-ACP methyl ester carboxylesterase